MPILGSRASCGTKGLLGGAVRYTVDCINQTSTSATATNSITLNVPTHTNGDTLLLCISYYDPLAAGTSGITDDAVSQGWTLVMGRDDDDLDFAVYKRTASSEPASYTFTASVTFDCSVALMSSYRKSGGTLTLASTSLTEETTPGSSGYLYWAESSTQAHYNVTAVGFAAIGRASSIGSIGAPDYGNSWLDDVLNVTTNSAGNYIRVVQCGTTGSHTTFGNSGNIANNDCYWGRSVIVIMYAE